MANPKNIIVAGFGPGISKAVAEKFGAEGYSVALVGRTPDRLASGVKALTDKGIKAQAFPTDLGNLKAVRELVKNVRSALGPISVIHWNAYPSAAGDFLTADLAELHQVIDLSVGSLLAAVQEALPDLRAQKGESGILVTNGGFGYFDPKIDEVAANLNYMGLAMGNSAKHKAVGMLAHKLRADGVYIGEVMVTGTVKGTAWDQGNATLDAKDIANQFWTLLKNRTDVYAKI